MRFDNRWCARALVVVAATSLAACQQRGGGDADSAQASSSPAAGSDTAPGASADTATVRADSVALRTDKTVYRAGEAMTLTLENRSASSYAFNPCTRGIEREEGGSWAPVPEDGRMCTMEAWILEPKGTRTGPTELPSPLQPGRYRVVVRMTEETSGGAPTATRAVMAISDPITVR